ncbi:hypothetical protein ACO0QE_003582 [Hanseniaspora vineae]
MVLYKRNPIVLPDPPLLPENLNINVWLIAETGEWFTQYEDYLTRMDYYSENNFSCEITGLSQLNFFQAMNSEEVEFENLERKFPLKVREPIAKMLHFNPTTNLAALVESVYNRFKHDYFPGEQVYLKYELAAVKATPWIIKEKALFPALVNTETGETTRQAFSKYQIYNFTTNESRIVDEDSICRDRSCFTKHLIKSFCKISLYKPYKKQGCPWCVKPEYLDYYNLTMDWPKEFLHFKESEVNTGYMPGVYDEETFVDDDSNNGLNIDGKSPSANGNNASRRKQELIDVSDEDEANSTSASGKPAKNPVGRPKKRHKSAADKRAKTNGNGIASNTKVEVGSPIPALGSNGSSTNLKRETESQVPEKPVSKITSITEDLAIPFDPNQKSPFNKFHKFDANLNEVSITNTKQGTFKEVGKLLIVYQFINTFNKILKIPLISLDDLITSLKCSNPQELAGETVHLRLALSPQSIGSEKEPINDGQRVSKYDTEIMKQYNKEGLFNVIISQDDPTQTIADTLIDDIDYNGTVILVELFSALIRLFIDETGNWSCIVQETWLDGNLADQTQISQELQTFIDKIVDYKKINWTDRVSKRQFQNGFWLVCLIGIFQDALHFPRYRAIIINIISKIMITDTKGKSSNAWNRQLWRNFVWKLSLEEKTQCLWVLVELVSCYQMDIKSDIDISTEVVTNIKSERYKTTKDYKATLKKQHEIEIQMIQRRKKLKNIELFKKIEAAKQENGASVDNSNTDSTPTPTATTITSDEKGKEKEEANIDSLNAELEKLQAEFEVLEISKKNLEADKHYWELQLRANSKQRMKPLGFDRFGNRYWYLELNGIDYSSQDGKDFHQTGKIYVQGPNEFDIQFYFDMSQKEYKEKLFKYKYQEGKSLKKMEENSKLADSLGTANSVYSEITPLERKVVEEGLHSMLDDDTCWAMIPDQETFETFYAWLNKFGLRESPLKKALDADAETISKFYAESLKRRQAAENSDSEEESRLLKEIEKNQFDSSEEELIKQYISSVENISTENKGDTHGRAKMAEPGQNSDNVVQKTVPVEDSASDAHETQDELSFSESAKYKLMKEQLPLLEESQKSPSLPSSRSSDGFAKSNNEFAKLFRSAMEPKIEKLQDLLSELHNYRYSERMEACSNWENKVALKEYGKFLWKGASNNGKEEPPLPTAEERMSVIFSKVPKHDVIIL